MRNKKILTLAVLAALIIGGFMFWREDGHEHAPAEQQAHAHSEEEKDEHGHAHGEGEHGEEGHVEVTQEIAVESGITVEEVAPATVRETVQLTGRILLNQNISAYVKARFSGVVREVKKSVGDTVAKGDVLAMVESNDSLQVYPVTAPLGGTVLERSVNAGDTASDAPIFVISDLSQLWTEFHVFPQDSRHVQMNQNVRVSGIQDNLVGDAQVFSMLPVAESATQTLVMRALLPNPEGKWRPSMIVHGDVATAEKDVSLAVKTEAIQRIGEDSVVFVQEGDRFEMRKLKLGISDAEMTEVLEGVNAGEKYASTNSFLLKAELGKSEANHEH